MANSLRFNFTSCSISYFSSSFSSSAQLSIQNKARSLSSVTNATKKVNKEDSHSFVPKLGEVTGFFPESILLKRRKLGKMNKARSLSLVTNATKK
ncbi:hypothetical protein RYX36_030788, partial [Vicia faba]